MRERPCLAASERKFVKALFLMPTQEEEPSAQEELSGSPTADMMFSVSDRFVHESTPFERVTRNPRWAVLMKIMRRKWLRKG